MFSRWRVWLDDPDPASYGGTGHPRPDSRIAHGPIGLQSEAAHRDSVGQDHADGAGLTPAPSDPDEIVVSVVEGACPLLGAVIVRGRGDLLREPEAPRGHSDQVHQSEGGDDPCHRDAIACRAIEEAPLSEALGHRAQDGARRVPCGSPGTNARRAQVMIEAPFGMGTPRTAGVPAAARPVDPDQPEATGEDGDGRPGRQGRWRR